MGFILTILIISVAFNGILCHPLEREEQLRFLFQNSNLKYLKDFVYFLDSPHLIEESSTAKSYIALNKPLIKSMRNLLPKNIMHSQLHNFMKKPSDKIHANNNVNPTNSWVYEEERKPIINNHPKSSNGNFITSGTETTGDYETTTDDLSFRIPPAPIVASLLG
ncbi:hypothetical protein evm_009015 [Chilo suppressalis]|nr:hypothetical protein evm_009015 [Chilo suppressalis]